VVVYKVKKNNVWMADPAHGLVKLTKQEFCDGWISDQEDEVGYGIALLLETTPAFYETEGEKTSRTSWGFLWSYLYKYKALLVQLIVGLLAGSILLLIGPFLTQSLVDMGIQYRDYNLVNLILVAMLAMFAGQLSVEFIRGWILLHLSARINISLISDFLIKLMKLPIGFFDTKMVGDILQRINDHARVKDFLTTSTLSSIFSFLNLVLMKYISKNISIFIQLIQ
jgi:ATP-binding cassette subfamily B protein